MSTQQIRNIITTQLDSVITRARDKARTEGRKKVGELTKKIPNIDELTKKLNPDFNESTCSDAGILKFEKIREKELERIGKIKTQVTRSIDAIEKVNDKLEAILNNGGPISKITNIKDLLEPILKLLRQLLSIVPISLGFLGGIGTGLAIKILSDKHTQAKTTVGEYLALFACLTAMFLNYKRQAKEVNEKLEASLNILNNLKDQVIKIEYYIQYLNIEYEQGCNAFLSGLENNVDGSINPNNILTLQQQAIIDITQTLYSDVLESLINQNKTKAAERVYKLGENFELGQQISYRVINPNLPNNIDNES